MKKVKQPEGPVVEWQIETSMRPKETHVFASFEGARAHAVKLAVHFSSVIDPFESAELRIWVRRVVRHR